MDLVPLVGLATKRRYGVRADQYGPSDGPGQMHAEKGYLRMGNGIDHRADDRRAWPAHDEVLATKWDDSVVPSDTHQVSEPVCMESCAIDDQPRAIGIPPGRDPGNVPRLFNPHHFLTENQRRTKLGRIVRQRSGQRLGIHDGPRWGLHRRDTLDVRLA